MLIVNSRLKVNADILCDYSSLITTKSGRNSYIKIKKTITSEKCHRFCYTFTIKYVYDVGGRDERGQNHLQLISILITSPSDNLDKR